MKRGRVVCIGEAIVDLVRERPGDALEEGQSFAAHFGGSLANAAVGASRFGAATGFVGAVGDDAWGSWLRRRLVEERVDVTWLATVEGAQTPHAFVTVSSDGEPSFAFYGDSDLVAAAAARIAEPLAGEAGVLLFGSDGLLGSAARELTARARELARDRAWQLVYDPNLRPARWSDPATMRGVAGAEVAGCSLVKCNREEATALTGASEPADAASVLLARGAGVAVVTLGAGGALLAIPDGEPLHVPAPVPVARSLDATGAGDCVTAVLAAALAARAGPAALPEVLALAMQTAARVVSIRGALAGLPDAGDARAALEDTLSRQRH
jgi:sugar/nucleoside kinase (ribokinase family)